MREASDLTWSAVRRLPDGTGRLKIDDRGDDSDHTILSAGTMRLLDRIRGDAIPHKSIIGLMPNQITLRLGAAAEQAGLGPGYSGESPRLGMLKDLDGLGVVLVGKHLEDQAWESAAGQPGWEESVG